MIKRSIQQDNMTLVNIYAPKAGASTNIERILTNIKEDSNSHSSKF